MQPFNVLSLFDGISGGQIALEKAGIEATNYLASEIDRRAIEVTQANFPDTIQIGDVKDVDIPPDVNIDLIMGGSPCQSFSFAGNRKGMATSCDIEITNLDQYLELKAEGFEFQGQSYLFWEYVRLCYQVNPKYFLLENVRMAKKWEKIISDTLGVEPIYIDSNTKSGQNRKRLYWTNIPVNREAFRDPSPTKIRDILEDSDCDFAETTLLDFDSSKRIIKEHFKTGHLDGHLADCIFTERFFKKKIGTLAYKKALSQLKSLEHKSNCLTTSGQNIANSGSTNIFYINLEGKLKIRPLNPTECERLQTVPEGYTDHCSRNLRISMLGNGWTIDVIAEILRGIK
ncbi:MAG: DNA (cytosine-5-)-methyltransferase [Deltaproteobacteria bacterium]|nr:DNA (cytosine-5-)-methyltransferase [Deltaproteobacteria bacterium]